MSSLSDVDIVYAIQRGDIAIDPFDQNLLQPASVDLRLGNEFAALGPGQIVDMVDRRARALVFRLNDDQYHDLRPGEFLLATTIEVVTIGPRHRGNVMGKSSPGRVGLMIHVTAGFIDPGFSGQVTLELYNVSQNTLRLRPGLAVCQIAFDELITNSARPYGTPGLGSRYQGQRGVQTAKP